MTELCNVGQTPSIGRGSYPSHTSSSHWYRLLFALWSAHAVSGTLWQRTLEAKTSVLLVNDTNGVAAGGGTTLCSGWLATFLTANGSIFSQRVLSGKNDGNASAPLNSDPNIDFTRARVFPLRQNQNNERIVTWLALKPTIQFWAHKLNCTGDPTGKAIAIADTSVAPNGHYCNPWRAGAVCIWLTPQGQIRGQFVHANLMRDHASFDVTADANPSRQRPVVASVNNHTLVVWMENVAQEGINILAMAIDENGKRLQSKPWDLCQSRGGDQSYPHLYGSDKHGYLAVWVGPTADRSGKHSVFFAALGIEPSTTPFSHSIHSTNETLGVPHIKCLDTLCSVAFPVIGNQSEVWALVRDVDSGVNWPAAAIVGENILSPLRLVSIEKYDFAVVYDNRVQASGMGTAVKAQLFAASPKWGSAEYILTVGVCGIVTAALVGGIGYRYCEKRKRDSARRDYEPIEEPNSEGLPAMARDRRKQDHVKNPSVTPDEAESPLEKPTSARDGIPDADDAEASEDEERAIRDNLPTSAFPMSDDEDIEDKKQTNASQE